MKKNLLKKIIFGSFAIMLLIVINKTKVNADNVNYYTPSIPAQYICYPYQGFKFSHEWYDSIEDGLQVFHINYENDSDTVIFYYYGGSFINNPLDPHWDFFNLLADYSDAEIIVPIYPMSYYQGSDERYMMLLVEYCKWKVINPHKKVIFAGDSAGGNLAVGMTQRLCAMGLPIPEKLVLISPWIDLSANSAIYNDYVDPGLRQFFDITSSLYAGDISRDDGRISVLNGNLSGLPETMVIAGEVDYLFPDIAKFADKLEACGVVTYRHFNPYLSHSYLVMYNQLCKNEIEEICEYIKES